MKRIFTLLAIFMSVLFSSVIFVSCSGYKKMYLQVQYVTIDDGEEVWHDLDLDKGLDYVVSDEMYSEADEAYLMYLKVNVKGTSKKVASLYVSSSTGNAILESNTVKPGEAIKVLIKSVGSVKFNIIPSEGGADKAVEFGVNIYKKLENIKQNESCTPALSIGGNIKLEQLTNLIKYEPLGETNQTGVSFKLDGIGTLNAEGEFVSNDSYSVGEDGMVIDKTQSNLEEGQHHVWLDTSTNQLRLMVNRNYELGKLDNNNVVKLIATSNYNETLSTDVFAYIVENFDNSRFLVSYSNEVTLNEDTGVIENYDSYPVGNDIKLFASDKDSEYRSTKIYTYTGESIYSFVSKPGMTLNVYVNGEEYDYKNTFQDELGIKISMADDTPTGINSIGLKIEAIYASEYDVEIVVNFEAFDFSASDKSPSSVLRKKIKVKVDSLATSVSINGKTYNDNTATGAEYINSIEAGQEADYAKLYTYYDSSKLGLPLKFQAVPINAIDDTVYVSFYTSDDKFDNSTRFTDVSLLKAQGSSVSATSGKFEITNNNRVYLKINETADFSKLQGALYMVCQVRCTPDEFKGNVFTDNGIEVDGEIKYKTEYKAIVIKLDVIGAVKNIYVNSTSSLIEGDTFFDRTYFENGEVYTAYLNLTTGHSGIKVDASQINITSSGGLKFSKDKAEWYDSINSADLSKAASGAYTLYLRSVEKGVHTLNISSGNGVTKEEDCNFVNVTSNVNSVNIDYDSTYIKEVASDTITYTKIVNAVSQEVTINRKFLALQAEKAVDFKVTTDGKTSTVKNIEVKNLSVDGYKNYTELTSTQAEAFKQKFEQNAVMTTRLNDYLFNMRANSVGFTSAIYVKVEYYYFDGLEIAEGSKEFIYEVAVYNMANNLTVSSEGKDEILYINSSYLDVARVRLTATINGNATSKIYFSTADADSEVNKYGTEDKYMYGIRVSVHKSSGEYVNPEYFSVTGLETGNYLNNLRKTFTIEALQKIKDTEYIYADFTLYQFGEASQPVRKILYIGDYSPSQGIVVDGVDAYSNLYLSLLAGDNEKAIYAEVANKDEATYTDLDYRLYNVNDKFEKDGFYNGDNLSIKHEPDSNEFTITAKNAGGKYILDIFSKDSYDDAGNYSKPTSIVINVSDGNENNPYLINTMDDFKNIANNLDKYFRLSDNINISTLNNTDWWNKDRIFKGGLDGAMTIYNPMTETTIHKQYSLIGLRVDSISYLSDGYYAGLFTSNEGTIKNVEFTNVSIDIDIDNSNSSSDKHVNIGAIAGVNYGTILNCTVNIISSEIVLTRKLDADEKETGASNTTYNIGLITGTNYKTIKVDADGDYMVDCASAGKLSVVVEKGNTNYNTNTNIYIGGIAGTNKAGEILGNYIDNSGKAFNSILTGVVNIELIVGDSSADELMNINNIALGGVVGYNASIINNVAITGKIKANDKASIGGIVGINGSDAKLANSANIGAVLEGYALSTHAPANGGKIIYHGTAGTNDELLEQNIGGIVGQNNAGNVENVRVLFVTFEYGDINICANESYIIGVGNIGGIIGKSNDTKLIKAYVENFIPDIKDDSGNIVTRVYNIIGNNANIGGFIGESDESSVTLGFVQADIDAVNGNETSSSVHEFGNGLTSANYSFVYFYGDLRTDDVGTEGGISFEGNVVINDTYIIENIIYNGEVTTLIKEGTIKIGENHGLEDIGITIIWRQQNEGKNIVNNGKPYLEYIEGGKTILTLTVSPSDIIVKVDNERFEANEDDKFKATNEGIYIQYSREDETLAEKQVSATAIVYFVENEDNKHLLVSDGEKGLIEKTILPSIANGEYGVRIISGTSIATLSNDDKSITFIGCGKVELEFYSLYNREVKDRAVIFVENKLIEGVFDINISGKGQTEIKTYVGSNTLAEVKLISDANINEGNTFDTTKLYSSHKIDSVVNNNGDEINEEEYNKYISVNPLTTGLKTYEIKSSSLPANVEYITATISFSVYLDLSKYSIGNKALSELVDDVDGFIQTKTLTVTIYNSATNIQITSSGNHAESGDDIDIEVVLHTGYRNETHTTDRYIVLSVDNSQDKIYSNIANQDNINISISAVNQSATNLISIAGVQYIWELFDKALLYRLYEEVISGTNVAKGYVYSLNLELKDEYKKYVTSDCEFAIDIWASSNPTVKDSINITFEPQPLTTFRMEHYANLVVEVENYTDVIAEYKASETQSSLIIPGSSGLMKIYAEPTYSYCDNIVISSSSIVINNKEYFIRYQQMVYNKDKDVYQSLAGITAEDKTLSLVKYSYINNSGEYEYDGVLFVRTILENVVGVKKTFTTTVTATTYDLDETPIQVSREKVLISQYKPGVYVSVSNAQEIIHTDSQANRTQGYLVERGSSSVEITTKVYGYEFNVAPNAPTISWLETTDESRGLPGEYISVAQKGEIIKANDGAYYITYQLRINSNCAWNFSVQFKMELVEGGSRLTSDTQILNFYPTEYILQGMALANVANNTMNIGLNSSKNIEFKFSTVVTTDAKQQMIKNKLDADLNTDQEFLDLFHVIKFNGTNNYKRYFSSYLEGSHEALVTDSFKIIKNADGATNRYRISAISLDSVNVYVDLYYGYIYNATTNNYEIVFSTQKTDVANNTLHYEFKLYLAVLTSEDAPEPIYSAEDFAGMVEGENYILMNDITLENWIPSTVNINSLDGNSKVITIKSFSPTISANTNVGLFASIDKDAIIKNVTINVAQLDTVYIKDDNTLNVAVNMGILAGENNGLVYNCEIIALSTKREINIILGDSYTMTFGGLIGVNNGNITNSRVGTEYYERLSFVNQSEGNYNVISNIIRCGVITFKSRGVMAGVVGVNTSGSIISASYMANTNIENTSNSGNDEINQTAGFVAQNAGQISYSYAKGKENTILTTKARAIETKLSASGSGSVAGFVFKNTGDILNCYSNIICESTSAVVAGFVYNHAAGSIKQCYSASIVLSGNTNVNLATELPFVGVGIDKSSAQVLLSYGEIVNSYYLDDGAEYDTNYLLPEVDTDVPVGISLTSFAQSSSLNNFTFIETGSLERQLNSVWTYSTYVDSNKEVYSLGVTNLPELTSANHIAKSLRYLVKRADNNDYIYAEANGYDSGSRNNPFIVRDVSEFNLVFDENATDTNTTEGKFRTGYIRFIDNIKFVDENGANIDIATKSNYLLGDNTGNVLTVLDGNGMTLSDISIEYANANTVESVGLFSKVSNAVIKSLNIQYDNVDMGSTLSQYSGGLAGIINNSYLMDLNLSGNVVVKAHNLAGGVAGLITGDSSLNNITSNLSATAGYVNSIRYVRGRFAVEDIIEDLSYSGGIAGIIDVKNPINRLVVNGANINADRAGGIAGYLGVMDEAEDKASRLTYIIEENSSIKGRIAAGGLVGENFANIQLSYVSAELTSQEDIDRAFANYINGATEELSGDGYGNLSAVTSVSDNSAISSVGGLIGVNYGGNINDSYTKASITTNARYAGGLTGINYGGSYSRVYAQNYIDLAINSGEHYVGGMFGRLGDKRSVTNTGDLGAVSLKTGVNNVVLANMFNKAQIEGFVKKGVDEPEENIRVLDYTIGYKDEDPEVKCTLGADDSAPIVLNYGVFNADAINDGNYKNGLIQNRQIKDATHFNMNDLYNLDSPNQKEIFEELFLLWDPQYWDLDNTKYMPRLKEDAVTDFIPIEIEKDLEKIRANPNGNFMLMNDIPLTKTYSNYVLDIDFRGVLMGLSQSADKPAPYPSFSNIRIDATDRATSAGFFKKTTGARINNVGFAYESNNGLTIKNNLLTVGGVSAEDNRSRFEKLHVAGKIKTNDGVSINNAIGYIVGASIQSSIIGCEVGCDTAVDTQMDVRLGSGAFAGGLVGRIDGESTDADTNKYSGLIVNSINKCCMDIEVNANASVGGIVGFARYTTISSCDVELDGTPELNTSYLSVTSLNADLTDDSISTLSIGGIVGNTDSVVMSDCITNINLLYDVNANADRQVLYLGGQIGRAQGSEFEIDGGISRLNSTVDGAAINTAYIGGVIGQTDSASHVNRVYAEIKYSGDNSCIASNVTFGGIVSHVASETTITNSMANLQEVTFSKYYRLIAGGLIGQVSDLVSTTSDYGYLIEQSNSVGQLFAENDIEDKTIATIIGGMVGYIGKEINSDNVIDNTTVNVKGSMKNSYTALTMSTAKVLRGKVSDNSHVVHDNAIIGLNNGQTTDINNVMYSSDYTLSLEQSDRFNVMPENVTAHLLLYYSEFANQGWIHTTGYLPLPGSLTEYLLQAGILTIDENDPTKHVYNIQNNGSAINPILINNATIINTIIDKNKYCYYNVTEDISFTETIETLNGMLLVNNYTIYTSCTLFTNIASNGAISNANVQVLGSLTDENATCIITNNNYGTLNRVSLDYTAIEAKGNFGGMVYNNYGRILYSYNTGYSKNTGNSGGLVYENGVTSSIENSYFTGTLEGGSAYAFAVVSNGYIANSYSAGNAPTGVFADDEAGRYKNVYFDYYATFLTDAFNVDGMQAYPTTRLQAFGTTEDTKHIPTMFDNKERGNWAVYGIKNPYQNSVTFEEMTYNYGYPIHKINQITLGTEGKELIGINAKHTGNGILTAENGGPIVNNSYLINNYGTLGLLTKPDVTTYGLYFELEYNITLPEEPYLRLDEDKLFVDWQGVGNSGNPFRGIFTTTNYTSEELEIDADVKALDERVNIIKNDNPLVITNFKGPSLFGTAENAWITNIGLKDVTVSNSTFVNVASNISLYNVGVEGEVKANGQTVSGLINITSGQVEISKLNLAGTLSFKDITNDKDTVRVDTLNGLINTNEAVTTIHSLTNSNMNLNFDGERNGLTINGFVRENKGTVIIGKADSPTTNVNVATELEILSKFSGFAGRNSGIIQTFGLTINIGEIGRCVDSLAGAVTNMEAGEVSGLTINFESNDAYNTSKFGGVVADISGGSIGGAAAVKDEAAVIAEPGTADASKLVTVTLPSVQSKNDKGKLNTIIYGGVIGRVAKELNEKVNISNVSISQTGEKITITANLADNNAAGIVIGYQEGEVSEINYVLEKSLELDVPDGKNIGGIIGRSKNGTYNFINETPEKVTVKGLQNVGGFIGLYEGEAFSLTGGNWVVVEEYAKVEVSVTEKGDEKDSTKNFGGLFGFWNSSSDLVVSGDEEDKYTIINRNMVCTDTIDEYKIDIENGYVVENVIKNVGGVVGQSAARVANAINLAQIGKTNEPKTVGLSDVATQVALENMSALVNVGGIVGNLQFDGGTTVNIDYCANVGKIYGYSVVGGIIGTSNCRINVVGSTIDESGTKTQLEIGKGAGEEVEGIGDVDDTIIVGFADVGGLIGRCVGSDSGENGSTIKGVKVSTNIYGVVNVGGLIGYASKLALIADCSIMSEIVTGNINVGGIIGNASIVSKDVIIEKTTIGFEDITQVPTAPSEGDEVAVINGSVFEYKVKADTETKTYYFLPTNIGGAFGRVVNIDTKGVITVADVITDEEYKITTEDGAENNILTVHSVANRIGVRKLDPTDTPITSYYGKINENNVRVETLADGGIGGLAGYAENAEFGDKVEQVEQGDAHNVTYATQVYGSTKAFYGINVGGTIGCYNVGSNNAMFPKISESFDYQINVAGKIFVGGYVGRIDYLDGDLFTEGSSSVNDETVLNGYINVQQYIQDGEKKVLSGSNIGGIAGYVTGTQFNDGTSYAVSGINLAYHGEDYIMENGHLVAQKVERDIPIRIFNADHSLFESRYVGVIAGRVDNQVINCSVAPELCDAIKASTDRGYAFLYTNETLAYKNDDDLVGIIQHPETYNYGGLVGLVNVPQGSTGDKSFRITGEHYYAFTVDMVQNQDYEQGTADYDITEAGDGSPNTISAIAHYINNSNITISASALNDLYDGHTVVSNRTYLENRNKMENDSNPLNSSARGWAKEYTMFRMMARVVPQSNEITGDSIQVIYNARYITEVKAEFDGKYNTAHDKLIQQSDYIVYTIYQPINQTAMLYTKYGIAYELDATGVDYEFSIDDEYDKKVSLVSDVGTSRDDFWKHIDITDESGNPIQKITDADEGQLTTGYTYFNSSGYLNRTNEDGQSITTTFLFKNVYGTLDYKIKDENGNEISYINDPSLYSNSGSLFEVTGTSLVLNVERKQTPPTSQIPPWATIVGFFLVSAALTIITGPVGATLTFGELFMIGVAGGLGAISFGVSAGDALAGIFVSISNKGKVAAEARLTQISECSMGMAHSIYTRNIEYTEGQLNPQTDAILTITVMGEADVVVSIEEFINNLLHQTGDSTLSEWFADGGKGYIDENTVVMPLSLQYLAYCSANVIPNDINDTVEIQIEKMEESSAKEMLTNLGLTKIRVPQYVKVDNEIYVYPDAAVSAKVLHKNYKEVKENESSWTDATLVEHDGYAYINMSSDKGILTDDEDRAYIEQQYKVDATISKNIPYNIVKNQPSGTEGYDWEKINLSDLRWAENPNANIDDELVKEITVTKFYAGIDVNSSIYGYFIDQNNDGIIEDSDFVGYQSSNLKAIKQGIALGNSPTEWDDEGIEVKVPYAPYSSSGNLFTEGKLYNDPNLNFSGNYYLEYNQSGNVKVYRTYKLYNQYYEQVTFDGDRNVYVSISEAKIRVQDEDGIITLITLNRENYNEHKDKIITDGMTEIQPWMEEMLKVKNNYKLKDGQLYAINSTSFYRSDEYGLLYKFVIGGSMFNDEGEYINYNKYVYNYDNIINSDGQPVKFYTRYSYEAIQSDFFNSELASGITIKTALMPTIADYTGAPSKGETLFAESARITFSIPSGSSSKVYLQYSYSSSGIDIEKPNNTVGKITCSIDDFLN